MNLENYPILEAFKKHNSNFNKSHFIKLPDDSNFGNLTLSIHQIIVRIDCVNNKIIELYNDFIITKKKIEIYGFAEGSLSEGYKELMIIEEIFYFLKKTTDELISMIFILTYFKAENKFPPKIKISSIGNLIYEHKKDKKPLGGLFDRYINLFDTLNNVHNAYKHSFINSQINAYRGAEYPVAFAYYLEHNDLKNSPGFYTIDIKVFLNDYDVFLKYIKNHIIINFQID
ncbi:hypothetical protein SLW70_12690 [Flavobacterium sp. NG2]|uniref:hypothetical protein n=1 Tax=Flavobacterium sp. NG2 TaxID=3097547 RepID=UPI002A7F750D|nr:hypothetical protein [Flavobacterium sp. NG2]WPR70783.1 hypothetical protein SLW70_12690 [Flavobacterium sp. NG2]